MVRSVAAWAEAVRPLPRPRLTRTILLVVLIVIFLPDIWGSHTDLSSVQGWAELIVPFLPLAALVIGALPAAVMWFITLAAVLALGAESSLVAAMITSTALVVGFCAYLLPWRQAIMFVIAVLLSLPLLPLLGNASWPALYVIEVAATLASAAGLGLNAHRRRQERSDRLVHDLRAQQQRIRRDERATLARELHDVVAHEVTIIALQARRTKLIDDPDRRERIMDEIASAASRSLHDLHDLISLLRDDEPDDSRRAGQSKLGGEAEDLTKQASPRMPLDEELSELAGALERAGFDVRLTVQGDFSLIPASFRQSLARTVRELCTNVRKHADPSGAVELNATITDERIRLDSTNSIAEAPPISSTRTGLEAMRVRCETFGGSVTAAEADGRWTTTITIPFAHTTTDAEERGGDDAESAARR